METPEHALRGAIDKRLLSWMRETPWRVDDARFDALALDVFAYQFEQCEPYARFCRGRGKTPDCIDHWRDIPAVPTGAFKEIALRCFPEKNIRKIFRTSGTSRGARGVVYLDGLDLYEASLMASLKQLLFPDFDSAQTRISILAPDAQEAPDSSLSHMFAVLLDQLGDPESGFEIRRGELAVDSVLDTLERADREASPLALCGTAFAFVHLLEAMDARGKRVRCPVGSRIMETGGLKGRARAISQGELYALLEDRLGIPPTRIVNQYGMTELGSQFYDSVLIDPTGPRRKLAPPWTRVRFIDPETGIETETGEIGMAVIFDLANTASIASIQTADLGTMVTDPVGKPIGFEVLGRQPTAEARGCSIAIDEMLAPQDPLA